jgi:hypothetical protein
MVTLMPKNNKFDKSTLGGGGDGGIKNRNKEPKHFQRNMEYCYFKI